MPSGASQAVGPNRRPRRWRCEVCECGRLARTPPQSGDELSVIVAAVVGGISLFGGKGTFVDSIVGVMMIGLIINCLIPAWLEFSRQLIARGGIIRLVAISQARR